VDDVPAFNVRRGIVQLKSLPMPDQIDFNLPAGHSCLIVDDGTDLTACLVEQLVQRDWPVVVLRLPQSIIPGRQALPAGVQLVTLETLDEEHLAAGLNEATHRHGPVAVFIQLQPSCEDCHDDGIHFTEHNRLILKEAFLAAKHLKNSLNQAARQGRAAFMTVVRMDGEFGLGDFSDFDPISGGLFGLVKSLNLEWESVFCRAVDLNPEIAADKAVAFILAELMDPNRMVVEVGYSANGRATLALEPTIA